VPQPARDLAQDHRLPLGAHQWGLQGLADALQPARGKTEQALSGLRTRSKPLFWFAQQFKTDAPNHVVFDILRAHAAKNPPKEGACVAADQVVA
jgi:hypothetical protein